MILHMHGPIVNYVYMYISDSTCSSANLCSLLVVTIARGNLNDLRMTGKWKDFPSFISEFERLADQGELSSSMQVYHLRHKVSVVIGL